MTAHPARWQPTAAARPAGGPDPGGDGCVLALDAGTGSCRAVLFDLAGRQVALAQREWSHPADPGVTGSQNFDTAGNWALICACIGEVLGAVADPGAVLAVGCTGMGGGLVLYDPAGRCGRARTVTPAPGGRPGRCWPAEWLTGSTSSAEAGSR